MAAAGDRFFPRVEASELCAFVRSPGTAVGAVASGRQEVLLALRGIRGTSAAFAAAYAVLFLSIVLGPYKRGETWAWWSLLGALALPARRDAAPARQAADT